MTSPQQALHSLLTEHFTYTPLTLLDDIINTQNELLYRAINAVESGLLSTNPTSLGFTDSASSPSSGTQNQTTSNQHPSTSGETSEDSIDIRAQREIETGTHALETLLQNSVDKNFDKLEVYVLRNVLFIAPDIVPWIRLAHYDGLKLPQNFATQNTSNGSEIGKGRKSLAPAKAGKENDAEEDVKKSTEEVVKLRRKVTETRKLRNALLAERERNKAIIDQVSHLLSSPSQPPTSTTEGQASLSFLTQSPSAQELNLSFPSTQTQTSPQTQQSPQNPLTKQTQALLPHLPQLQNLLHSLRTHLSNPTSQLNNPTRLPQRPAKDAQGDTTMTDNDAENVGISGNISEEQRRKYIETQTKKRLMREGVAVDDDSGVANTARVRKEDLDGIERVSTALGGK